MIVKEADQIRGEITAQDNDVSRPMDLFCHCGDSIGVQRIAKPLQISDVNIHRLANVR